MRADSKFLSDDAPGPNVLFLIAGVEGVHPLDTSNVPGCTYCWPQVASIGLSERSAIEKGHEIKVIGEGFVQTGFASFASPAAIVRESGGMRGGVDTFHSAYAQGL